MMPPSLFQADLNLRARRSREQWQNIANSVSVKVSATMNTNIDNREERMKDVSEVEKIIRERNKRKEWLELRKKLLNKEIYDARTEPEKLKSSLHVKANPVLTAQSVHGYVLCDHSIDQINEKEKTYSASCKDAIHSFKMSVKINDKEITSVDLNLAETSAILEVKDLLATISEERCPHLLLLTIQQFIQLYCFRVKVIHKLTSTKAFQVYHPQFNKHKGLRPTCLISARSFDIQQSATIEIQWTFRWNNAYNSLVHHFIIPKETVLGPTIQRKLDHLRDHTFSDQNQHWLMMWWEEFRNAISTL